MEMSMDEIKINCICNQVESLIFHEPNKIKYDFALSYLRTRLLMCAADFKKEFAIRMYRWAIDTLNADLEAIERDEIPKRNPHEGVK